jgi:hypothetical protein
VAAGAVRRARDQGPLRYLPRPGEPREAERSHDRAPCGRRSCVLRGEPEVRARVSCGWAGRRRDQGGARRGLALESAEQVSRPPACRPARHGGIATPARCRRGPVRHPHGDERPGCGAGGPRLSTARRIRRLVRSNRGAGLPEAPSLAGAFAHPLCCLRARRHLLRPLRRQRPAPSTSSRSCAPRKLRAARRSRTGRRSSTSSRRHGTSTRCTA